MGYHSKEGEIREEHFRPGNLDKGTNGHKGSVEHADLEETMISLRREVLSVRAYNERILKVPAEPDNEHIVESLKQIQREQRSASRHDRDDRWHSHREQPEHSFIFFYLLAFSLFY